MVVTRVTEAQRATLDIAIGYDRHNICTQCDPSEAETNCPTSRLSSIHSRDFYRKRRPAKHGRASSPSPALVSQQFWLDSPTRHSRCAARAGMKRSRTRFFPIHHISNGKTDIFLTRKEQMR